MRRLGYPCRPATWLESAGAPPTAGRSTPSREQHQEADMRMSARSWMIASVGLVGAFLAGAAEGRDLTVVAWGGGSQAAARKVYFVPFAEKTGIKLQEDSWSGGIGVLRTKVKGGNAGWDVVQVEVD